MKIYGGERRTYGGARRNSPEKGSLVMAHSRKPNFTLRISDARQSPLMLIQRLTLQPR